MRSASSAGMRAPVRIISSALPRPTSRGSRCVPPPPGMMARLISVRPSVAVAAATRMSHASASSRPPPRAKPLTAARIGCGQPSMAWRKSTRRRRSRNCTGTSGATNSRMSAPAENAFSPAPVTTTTLTSSSTARASKQRVSSRRMASFIALWTSGRFSVSVATCSATSYTSVSYFVLTRGSSGTARSSDDLAGAEPGPRGGVVAGGAEHLVGVLAERRRGAHVARRRLREEQRRSRQGEAADLRMIVLARQPVMPRQRMAAELVDRVHGAGRDIVRQQHLAIVEPQHPGGEAGVVREVLEPERLAQLDPERLVAAGEEEPLAVAGLVEPIGRVVAEDRLFAGIVDEISGLQGRHRVQQRRLHLLADAAALADEEGREHRLGGERRRVVIDERDADILWRTAEALQ